MYIETDIVYKGADYLYIVAKNVYKGADSVYIETDIVYKGVDDVYIKTDIVYKGADNVYIEAESVYKGADSVCIEAYYDLLHLPNIVTNFVSVQWGSYTCISYLIIIHSHFKCLTSLTALLQLQI